jgi:hypothetical protein
MLPIHVLLYFGQRWVYFGEKWACEVLESWVSARDEEDFRGLAVAMTCCDVKRAVCVWGLGLMLRGLEVRLVYGLGLRRGGAVLQRSVGQEAVLLDASLREIV